MKGRVLEINLADLNNDEDQAFKKAGYLLVNFDFLRFWLIFLEI